MTSVDKILGEAMTPHQKRIYQDPQKAYRWAFNHTQRFPEAEPYIANDLKWACWYAKVVIRGRWPEAEATLAKSPEWAYRYAHWVIGGRWPEAEETIAKDPEWAFDYARYIIRDRWPEAEETIAKDPEFRPKYLEAFPDAADDWVINGLAGWIDT